MICAPTRNQWCTRPPSNSHPFPPSKLAHHLRIRHVSAHVFSKTVESLRAQQADLTHSIIGFILKIGAFSGEVQKEEIESLRKISAF